MRAGAAVLQSVIAEGARSMPSGLSAPFLQEQDEVEDVYGFVVV